MKINDLAPKLIALETLVGPVKRLGHGGFGVVYQAKQQPDYIKPVAVKEVRTMLQGGDFIDAEALGEIINEALMLLAAGGTYTLALNGIGWDPSIDAGATYYLVTECCLGGSLEDVLYTYASALPPLHTTMTTTPPLSPPLSIPAAPSASCQTYLK